VSFGEEARKGNNHQGERRGGGDATQTQNLLKYYGQGDPPASTPS